MCEEQSRWRGAEGWRYFRYSAQGGFTGKGTLQQRPEGGAVDECGKGVPSIGKNRCKGPEVRVASVCLRNSKDETGVAWTGEGHGTRRGEKWSDAGHILEVELTDSGRNA